MSAERALRNQPFKSFVVAWLIGDGIARLIQDEESQGMFSTATSLKTGIADNFILTDCASLCVHSSSLTSVSSGRYTPILKIRYAKEKCRLRRI